MTGPDFAAQAREIAEHVVEGWLAKQLARAIETALREAHAAGAADLSVQLAAAVKAAEELRAERDVVAQARGDLGGEVSQPKWILKWSLDGTYLTLADRGDERGRDRDRSLNKWTKDPRRARVFTDLAKARKACEDHDGDALGLVPEMLP